MTAQKYLAALRVRPYGIRTVRRISCGSGTIFRRSIRLQVQMEGILSSGGITAEQNRRVSDVVAREQSRLRQFIRSRVRSDSDAEDIFQEVFYELVDAYRLAKPLEQVGAWLYRVARNRITDLFRSRRSSTAKAAESQAAYELEAPPWEELLPSPVAVPDVLYVRNL